MHKKLTYIKYLLIAVFLMASLPGYADFQAGVDAYEAGDYETAFKEFKVLAEQGYANAQFNLGNKYRKGEGVPQDYKEAIKWYRKAAEQGNIRAQFNLGLMHYNFGLMYYNGQGVPQDYAECYAWMNIVAASGNENAKYNRDECASKLSSEALSKAQEKAAEYWEKYGSN